MENNSDYWFMKYDMESFEKEFTRIPYNDFLNSIVLHPDFKSLPGVPIRSQDQCLNAIQECILQFNRITTEFLISTREHQRDTFYRWVRQVLAYMDCEKLYGIMFWNIEYIPSFVECRCYASLVRIYKYLISLIQNIVIKDMVQRQVVIRTSETLNLPFTLLLDYQKSMLKIFKPLMNSNPTLISKIYYCVFHMYDKPLNTLKKDLDLQYSLSEVNWVKRILSENAYAIKQLDAYLDGQDVVKSQQFSQYEESEILKQMSRDFYRVDEKEKPILEKSKRAQLLELMEKKARKNYGKSSIFVKDSSIDIGMSKYKSKLNAQKELDFKSISSTRSYQDSELFRAQLAPINKFSQVSTKAKESTIIQQDLDDQLVEFISKADSSIAAIKDEDIIFDEGQKKKRYRMKKRRQFDENDSPDFRRKQTVQVEDNGDGGLIRLINTEADKQEIDLFQYSFEDSLEEDGDQSDQEDCRKRVEENCIIFDKFRYLSGDVNMSQTRKNNIVKRLFSFHENSLSVSGKSLLIDYEERKWTLLRDVIRSTQFSSKDKVSQIINDVVRDNRNKQNHIRAYQKKKQAKKQFI